MRSGLNAEAREFFRKQGARGGKIGLKGRMEKLTPEERSAIAKNAVRIRELKRKQNGTAAALETETELAESTSQTKKRNA
jgi:hypothetical protein